MALVVDNAVGDALTIEGDDGGSREVIAGGGSVITMTSRLGVGIT